MDASRFVSASARIAWMNGDRLDLDDCRTPGIVAIVNPHVPGRGCAMGGRQHDARREDDAGAKARHARAPLQHHHDMGRKTLVLGGGSDQRKSRRNRRETAAATRSHTSSRRRQKIVIVTIRVPACLAISVSACVQDDARGAPHAAPGSLSLNGGDARHQHKLKRAT